MRHRAERRDPRLTHVGMMVGVAAVLAAIAFGTNSCSDGSGASVAPPVAAPSKVAPTPTPTPTQSSSATVPSVVGAAHLARSVPVRLQIARIGVDSPLMDLRLQDDGAMEVPPLAFPAGWYTGAPTPGELGPAIIAGHVDLNGPGVFYDLHNLTPGDRVTVTRKDGSRPVFRVTSLQQFPKDQFPTEAVYGDIDHPGLRLITCGGSFNQKTRQYEDNIVAFAELVVPSR